MYILNNVGCKRKQNKSPSVALKMSLLLQTLFRGSKALIFFNKYCSEIDLIVIDEECPELVLKKNTIQLG